MEVQKNKPVKSLEEKQAFWAEQLPNFEAKYWLPDHFSFLTFDMDQGNYVVKDSIEPIYEDDAYDVFHRVNTGWAMWIKAINFVKAQAVPEGFVLVPKSDLESWHLWNGDYDNMYRDHYSESICDDVELGAVFEIDAKMAFKVAPIYVVPIYSDSDDYEYEEFESEELAQKAAAENKAMIEAQEQSHE